ncbi:MAG TPA: RING finger protein, partial [Ramlibacter sp.]|nr:RING finger protein [Ramlibacter sp.]
MPAEENACKYCQEPADAGRPLLKSPCGCTGTLGYVHEACLRAWVSTQGHLTCSECTEAYTSKTTPLSVRAHLGAALEAAVVASVLAIVAGAASLAVLAIAVVPFGYVIEDDDYYLVWAIRVHALTAMFLLLMLWVNSRTGACVATVLLAMVAGSVLVWRAFEIPPGVALEYFWVFGGAAAALAFCVAWTVHW